MSVNQSRTNLMSFSRTRASTSSVDVPAPGFVSIAISLFRSLGGSAGGTCPPAAWFLDAGRDLAGLVCLEDLLAGLAGPDPDRVLDRQDEDLAVADLAGPGVLQDRL